MPATNICVWLNGARESERPIWSKLWNNAEKRYCTDGGANQVVNRDQKLRPPDVVVGDMDSILPMVKDGLKLTTLLIHTPDQNKTDLTKCLEGARVVLLGGTSGRFDHVLAAINSMLYSTTLMTQEVFCLEGENLTFVLNEGEHYIKVDQKLITGTCGVIPFCQKTTVVTMTGFRWNLEGIEMAFGGLISTSNVIEENVLQIKTTAPLLFTMELQPSASEKIAEIINLWRRVSRFTERGPS
ncbi:thiamine diphosphokinase [Dictyocaulus viviparus]|uniref:Thiamine diphosphokinase n=1 Tax=Dictyocaulus viviparus TaxID=29172 RepID=A0A0D8XT24_DICVI|nr:thiamine diphosphokinase [Dictyocaulus viviparus]